MDVIEGIRAFLTREYRKASFKKISAGAFMTRLRWLKDELTGDLIAGPVFAGKDDYCVFISIPKLQVSIYSSRKDYDIPIKFTTLTHAKKAAKQELIKLGAKFYDEVRKK